MLPVRGPHHHHPGTLGLLGSCGGGTGWGLTSHPQRDSHLPPGVAVGAQPSPHSCWDALPSSSPDHSCPGLIRDTPPISSSSAPFPEPSYLSVYILVLCNLNKIMKNPGSTWLHAQSTRGALRASAVVMELLMAPGIQPPGHFLSGDPVPVGPTCLTDKGPRTSDLLL